MKIAREELIRRLQKEIDDEIDLEELDSLANALDGLADLAATKYDECWTEANKEG
jgi:hypothetical protein